MDFTAWGALLTNWPTDWILIGAFAAVAAFDAMRSGPTRAAALALSLPAALLLLQQLPKALLVGPLSVQLGTPFAQAGIFAAAVVIMYIATHRLISNFSNGLPPIQALLTGLATAIVLVVVWLQVPALGSIWHFGPQAQAVFGVAYHFWWLLGSYAALAAVRS